MNESSPPAPSLTAAAGTSTTTFDHRNDSSVIIIDPAHDVDKISRTVAGREDQRPTPRRIHISAAPSEAAERFGAPACSEPRGPCVPGKWCTSPGTSSRTVDGDVPRIGDTELKRPRDPATPRLRVLLRTHQLWRTAKASSSMTPSTARRVRRSAIDTIIESMTRLLSTSLESTAVLATRHGDSIGIGLKHPNFRHGSARSSNR